MNAINTASQSMADDKKVQATIIDTTLVIERNETGSTEIDIDFATGDTDDILENLGILNVGKTDWGDEKTLAKNLAATIDGIAISKTSNTGIDDVLAGVTMSFEETGSTTLEVSNDTDSIMTMIEDFVTNYNTAMGTLEDQMSVDTSGGGDDIESGTLQSESLVRSMHMRMRTLTTSNDSGLDDDFESLRQIGIWTTGENNRLTIDSAKLEEALKNNFDEVEDLFRDYDYGVVRKVDDYLDGLTSAVDGSIDMRKQTLENSMDDKMDRIAEIEDSLTSYENSLYQQFARMEEAMAQMQGQLGFLGGLFANSGQQAK